MFVNVYEGLTIKYEQQVIWPNDVPRSAHKLRACMLNTKRFVLSASKNDDNRKSSPVPMKITREIVAKPKYHPRLHTEKASKVAALACPPANGSAFTPRPKRFSKPVFDVYVGSSTQSSTPATTLSPTPITTFIHSEWDSTPDPISEIVTGSYSE
ncbi:hypothetical protein RUND412_010609 [Rhizina undulata]